MRALLAVLALFALAMATGCTGAAYVAQAACGQLDLASRKRTIRDVVADPTTPPRVRDLLARVPSIKRFAVRHGLTPTDGYDDYADLERDAAVWVVTASEPLRFAAKTWTFPVVGNVPYLGWFDRRDAIAFARELAAEGWDVDVRGAEAYSTLGWFTDPVLSTMLEGGDDALGELANTVLHESVHATVYLPGQSALNESIASFVGDGLTLLYLAEATGPSSPERRAYEEGELARERRTRLLRQAYARLATLYASNRPPAEKLAEKRLVLDDLRVRIGSRRPITNATLAQFKTYNSGRAELDALLRACGGSYARLLRSIATLRDRPPARAQEPDLGVLLRPLVRAGCPVE